jgi:hypothetical protein
MIEETAHTAPAALASSRPVAGATFLLLGLMVVGTFLLWTDHDGGFAPEQWLPGGLLLVAVLAALCAAADARARLRAAWVPATLLAAYAAFSYLSIAWAESPGDAVDGANRTAVYAIVFAVATSLSTRATRGILPAAWAAGVVLVALGHFLQAANATGPRGFFIVGRFAAPITYPDAEAAILLMGTFTLCAVAARRETPALARAAAAALACAGAELAVLAQSRGSLVAVPLALIVWLVLSRNSLRTLAAAAIVAAAVGPAMPTLLDVYRAVVRGTGYREALRDARLALVLGMLGAAFVVGCISILDRRWAAGERTGRVIRRGLTVALTVATVGAVVAAFTLTHPVAQIRHAWTDFTTNRTPPPETIHLASDVGTSRYDVWRIALHQFAHHPIGGVGADNYLAGYLRDRRTVETARYPESIVLRALSETGLVGAVLFFGFLAAAFTTAIRVLRRESPLGPVFVTMSATLYWLFHGSVDWFWEFPSLTAPAIAFLGLACGAQRSRPSFATGVARAAGVAAGAAAVVAAGALLCCWIAVEQVNQAIRLQATPVPAYALLRKAERWNPLSEQPHVTEAAIAANALDRGREARALHAALRKNPGDWYAYLMLGIVAGRQHKPGLAAAYLQRAHRLSPLDPVVIYAQENLHVGNPLKETEIAAIFMIRTRTLRGVAQR